MRQTVEVRKRPDVYISDPQIRQNVQNFIQAMYETVEIGSTLEGWEEVTVLGNAVEKILVADACESEILQW